MLERRGALTCSLLTCLVAACASSKQGAAPDAMIEAGDAGAEGDGDAGGDGDADGDGDTDGDGDAGGDGVLDACLAARVVTELRVTNVDKVDLLFVVDNSGSMVEEQQALREQFPKLIRTLASGQPTDATGTPLGPSFTPAEDLHLAVVTSDMGLVGISGIDKCSGFGDDGKMQRMPPVDATGCPSPVPTFLTYAAGSGKAPDAIAEEFGCIATLGTEGCGFEQQLEAGLKALWPAIDIDPNTGQQWVDPMTGMPSNRITFLRDAQGNGRLGHGGPAGSGTANAGFLRNGAESGPSLIAIVVVTDEEDCSSLRTDHFTPPMALDVNDPRRTQDLNLRCYFNGDNLYRIERYINGFKALRPGHEDLVVFAAIAGVPSELVSREALESYTLSDEASREAFYTDLLNDERMQERIDDSLPMGSRALVPSCNVPGVGKAYPPRRLVQVAQGFGENGTVQSICQDDFGPAMDQITRIIGKRLGGPCLQRELTRGSDGKVDCQLLWQLPLPNQAPAGTPTSCSAESYLIEPGDEAPSTGWDGRPICLVRQLGVQDSEIERPDGAEGWYYDDFSAAVAESCATQGQRTIAFSPRAVPPTGVTAHLVCRSGVASPPGDSDGNGGALIGDRCTEGGDEACLVRTGGGTDPRMFCHAEQEVCVLGCVADTDCPPTWVCDASPETRMASGRGAICMPADCLGPRPL